jgi:NADPH:quinone reductase-like Zn-dependent oxidoreductase
MKAIVCTQYGTPDVLQFKEVEKPIPRDNEALVKVMVASVNASDIETLRGDFVVRMMSPLRPKNKIPGTDFAGKIEAIGRNVTHYKPGDEIWGDLSFPYGSGTFAEYVSVPENALRLKPAKMKFEEAAAIPTAAVVALQKLGGKNQIQPEQKVLINGAGGGVGTFAVQIARHFGAEVTAVDNTGKLEMLKSIGANYVIDHTKEDFTRNGNHYDLILDIVIHRSVFDYRRVLKPGGICVMVGGPITLVFFNMLLAPLISRNGDRKMRLGTWKPNNKKDMDYLAELFEAGKLKPIIDRRYPLSDVPEAFRYLRSGNALGKIVIYVANDIA